MSSGRSDFRPPEELDELSPQLRELDRYLLLDGAVWRRRLPDAAQAAHRAVSLLEQPRRPTADLSTLPTEILPAQHAPTSYPAPSAQPDRRRPASRTQRLVAAAAAIAVVALLAALLHSVVPGRQGISAHTPTHTPTPLDCCIITGASSPGAGHCAWSKPIQWPVSWLTSRM